MSKPLIYVPRKGVRDPLLDVGRDATWGALLQMEIIMWQNRVPYWDAWKGLRIGDKRG